MAKIFIGIDPGLHGAVTAVDGKFQVLGLEDTPVFSVGGKLAYNIPEMAALLRRFALMGEPLAVLEQAQAMPGQGVSSTFSTGYGLGLWSGILGALEIPYRAVRPSVWTRKILDGAPGQGKARVIAFASKMFPAAELIPEGCRKPRDGRADALALACWGMLS
jgi:crossover junction endodeoxyribonuclease RuvC